MDTLEAIRTRRSVKHFDPAFEIPAADEKQLLNLMRQAPTSFNMQNWRIVNVKDKKLREDMCEAAWGQKQVRDASLLLLMCADIHAWDKSPERYWTDAPKEAQDVLVPMIKPFYEGREWQQRDEAMRSIGIAAQTLLLGATAMGYDTCPMIGFDPDKIAALINLPQDHAVGLMITIGKATKEPWPKPGYLDDDEVFITDRFAG